MHVKVFLYSCLFILMSLCLSGCSSTNERGPFKQFHVSLPLVETLQYALAEKPKRWQLTIGAYEVLGTVVMVDEDSDSSVTQVTQNKQWRFTSDKSELIIFADDGIREITSLAGRPLDYQVRIVGKSVVDKHSSAKPPISSMNAPRFYRQIKIGAANYATLICTNWQYALFSKAQICEGKLKHTVSITTNSKGQPVRIEQWLPFLNQQLVLQQIH